VLPRCCVQPSETSGLVLVHGTHHFIFLSNPEETYAAVAAFLAATDRR